MTMHAHAKFPPRCTPLTSHHPPQPLFQTLHILPHRLYVILNKLPLLPRLRHRPHQRRLPHLLHKPQSPHRSLPIANIPRLHLNECHPRIISRTIMFSITQVSKPCGCGFIPDIFDARVGIGGGGYGARDGYPVLVGTVLEGEERAGGGGDVAEFCGVPVGEEEEVWAYALCRGEWELAELGG